MAYPERRDRVGKLDKDKASGLVDVKPLDAAVL